MVNITLRSSKGSPLTNNEVDSNFGNLNDFKVEQTASNGSAVIPSGNTATRDGSPSAGYLRYNTDDNRFEGWNGSSWGSIGGGITSLTFDSASGQIKLVTEIDSFPTVITLDPFSTTDLTEGNNLYYTQARVDSAFDSRLATKSTTNLTEGDNLYYTTARHDSDFNAVFGSTFDTRLGTKTTTNLTEGSNLYYTVARVDSAFDVRFAIKSTTDLSEGNNLYYTTARADSDFDVRLATKSTTNLAEGNNLYYTTARADSDAKAAISVTDAGGDGSLTYNAGVITYTGPSASEVRAHFSAGTGVAISSGEVSIGQAVSTTSDVTFAQITGDSAILDGVSFNAVTTGTYAGGNTPGTLFWDSDEQKGLSFVTRTREGNVGATVNIGQEVLVYVHNQTGGPVANGDVVYISGTAHGAHPSITKAQANASVPGTILIATQDIADGQHGYATRFGLVRDVNTGGLTEGDTIYLSADSAGVWTTSAVTVDDGYPLHIGRVLRVDSSTGTILVDPFSEHFEYLRIEDRLKVTGGIEGTTLMLDSSMSLAQIDYLKRPTYLEGKVWYDQDEHAIANHTADSEYTHYAGQRDILRGRNSSGSTILKGTPVYSSGVHISGHPIHGHHPLIYPADASDNTKIDVLGIAAHDIADGAHGYIISRGWLDGLNTAALTTGNPFHLAPSGGFVEAAPSYPNYPVQLGTVLTQDSAGGNGSIYIDVVSHSYDQLRVSGDARVDGNVTVGGDLTVLGSSTTASSTNISIGGAFNYFNGGDTIGEANTTFQGSGLDDAALVGHYTGTASDQAFYVKIDSAGGTDTFEWGYDSASPEATGISITGSAQALNYGISVNFNATTGHTVGDKWLGTASPVNVDTGWFSNRNTGTSGVGYTHMGMFFDVSTNKFTLLKSYDPEPEGILDLTDSSVEYGTLKAATFEGNLVGSVVGNASTASSLATSRLFSISGDVTANAVGFDGAGNVALSAAITANSIVNADINSAAAIADTKLATISTAGKVQNSATTATSANTASAIVTRDASGNFSAGTITADFDRSANTSVNAGVYGSASLVPIITVDASGFIDSIGTTSVAGVQSLTFDSASGKLTIGTADGSFFDENIKAATGVAAGTYGSASLVPVFTVNKYGTLDSAGTVSVAGVASVAFDSAAGSFTINTADGGSFVENIRAKTNVAAGTYGSASLVPVFTVDAYGRLDSAGEVSVAGVSSVTWDSATAVYTIGTADGGSYPKKIVPASSFISHDNTTGFVANEHIDHSTVTITAGAGLTGGGTIEATRTLNIGQGTGITVAADAISTNDAEIVHDNLSGFVANEHIDHSTVTITAGNGLTGGGTIEATRTLNVVGGGGINVGADNITIDSAEVRALFSATGSLSYNSGTGEFSFTERTASELLTAIKTVDGASSGLDADLLDGQHGSYYRINVYDATGTLLN